MNHYSIKERLINPVFYIKLVGFTFSGHVTPQLSDQRNKLHG